MRRNATSLKRRYPCGGISGKYLYSPVAMEPPLGANRNAIRNPHLIYPGQVLVLRYVNGQPDWVLNTPKTRSDGIPVINCIRA